MAFVQFSRVSLAFGDRDILKEVSLFLASGSRAALTGANGSGKSTLMRVIAGKFPPDSGDRAIQKGSRVSYLSQSGILHRGRTLREEAETAYQGIAAMLSKMEEIGRILETVKRDDARTALLLDEYHWIQERVEHSGYYNRDASITMVLSGLGFLPSDMDRSVEEFFGGWQMRIALAKVLLETPDILLLDEPTNYLDIEARAWLESWLRSFTGGCLLVSHDRYLLDLTVTEVYELFQGNLKRYAGNYTAYEQVRKIELESLIKRCEAQQEEIVKTEDLILHFQYKASKAVMVQERIKKLAKLERIEVPESLKKIRITFPSSPHGGRIALTLEGIGKNYGERRVLSGLDLVLEFGERLVFEGVQEDILGMDILLDTLKAYTGTIIFVSHDRAFMEALSTKTLELSPQGSRLFYGNYAYYMDRVEGEMRKEESAPPVPIKTEYRVNHRIRLPSATQQREANKRRQTLIRRLERQEATILQVFEGLEGEKARLEGELGKSEVYSNRVRSGKIQIHLDGLIAQIEAKTGEWEEKARELEYARKHS